MSEVERKLLARLTSPAEIALAHDLGTRPEQFAEPLYGAAFNFIIDYWDSSQRQTAPTSWALTQQFPGLTLADEAEETTEYLVHLLRQHYVTNRLQDLLRSAARTSTSDPEGTLKTLYADAYAANEVIAPRLTRVNMADTIQQRRERYARRADHPQGLGVPYGLDLLDLHTGGILPGELAVVGAKAKTGKTLFLFNAAIHALRQGYKPLVYSLEISLDDAQERLDAVYSGVSYNRLSKGHLSIDELQTLHAAQQELASRGGLAVERPETGERTVAHLCARARQLGADFLLLDPLSFMEPGVKVSSLKEHHAAIIRQLKNEISRPGRELPCLLAAHLQRGDEEITLESFSNAKEIEDTADALLGLSRNQDLRNNRLMKCSILAARRSDVAHYLLRWDLTDRTEISAYQEVRS